VNRTKNTNRTVIIGGGVIGLSIAYELATRGHRVAIVDQGEFGMQASWAGAGMLPPANGATAIHPLEHLEALSNATHAAWAARLREETGIDNGYLNCGSLYVARTAGEIAALTGGMLEWDDQEIEYQRLDLAGVRDQYPALAESMERAKRSLALWVPGSAQFRNPWHLKALVAACEKLDVQMVSRANDVQLVFDRDRLVSVQFESETLAGDQFVFAAGAWTEKLLASVGVRLPMQPVRGQMALYQLDPNRSNTLVNGPIINEGSRYLVPRSDGHVLAGATIEEVGFSCETSPAEVADLRAWAEGLVAGLDDSTYQKSWAGLRPGTHDGFAYIGPLRELENAFVATGHFKAGLQLSAGTAIVIADMVEGKKPSIDMTPFDPSRVLTGGE
jgi:glycine oxidase